LRIIDVWVLQAALYEKQTLFCHGNPCMGSGTLPEFPWTKEEMDHLSC